MRFRIMASRHSAFYSPLLCTVAQLRKEAHDAGYSVLQPGQRSHELIRDGAVDIMQSAVSSNWKPREQGIEPLPVHFAQINQRDGFFLTAREADPSFRWTNLEGRRLAADPGLQPFAMLKYALAYNGVDSNRVEVVKQPADYAHVQLPAKGAIVASVGASMPPVAFSSLCCSREYQGTEEYRVFLDAYRRSREFVRARAAEEVAAVEAAFFPEISSDVLTGAVRRYQQLGCWEGGLEISRELYDQALHVFEAAGEIRARHPYEAVVQS